MAVFAVVFDVIEVKFSIAGGEVFVCVELVTGVAVVDIGALIAGFAVVVWADLTFIPSVNNSFMLLYRLSSILKKKQVICFEFVLMKQGLLFILIILTFQQQEYISV